MGWNGVIRRLRNRLCAAPSIHVHLDPPQIEIHNYGMDLIIYIYKILSALKNGGFFLKKIQSFDALS